MSLNNNKGHRTESGRMANEIRPDGERNPIGLRTESNWKPNGTCPADFTIRHCM
nr:MAG TPA: hypothetical protein [Caudoviricetes sp.]DAW52532.1 MAG TPA: hypothetical protein [Bacteriophage sp.]